MAISDTPTSVGTNPSGIVARFEQQYAEYRRQKRVYAAVFAAVFLLCLIAALLTTQFNVLTLIGGIPRASGFISKMLPPIHLDSFAQDFAEWYWGAGEWFHSLLNTLLMAYLATILGTVIGGTISFFAARNLAQNYLVYWIARRVLEIARTVPDIVWALLFVLAFGIGEVAGIMAITTHTLGAQGKLFAEVNENISPLPTDGIRSAGGNWFHEMRFGVLPQVLPNYLSYTFWRVELNVRSATIVGFVGAGGIGHDLFTAVQLLYFADVGAILLIIVATIMAIDILSESIRHSAIGKASFSH
ncbi:MAG: phosphonate ABC transporter, permease protein PhnE [Betaproteobacteria bacterium]|nr:MAG: phosphonate ABC transporter, permease protein PhnE [Betaproteobacteria bacterium]